MLQPLKHRILVQKEEPKKETESGLVIPESIQEDAILAGIVLALGKDADENLQIGNKVLFGKYDGTAVDAEYCDGKKRCVVIADNQVRCIINEKTSNTLG